jgi:hypothetical protein
MSNRSCSLALAMVVLVAGSAAAQDVFHFEQVGPGAAIGLTFEQPLDVLAAEPLDSSGPVTGAPYSADIVTEVVQPLADGNRIERRSTSVFARDAQGRVRRELQLAAIGPLVPSGNASIITITDPVAGAHYSLDRDRKVATRSPMPFIKRFEGPPGAGERRVVEERMAVQGGALVARRAVIAGRAAMTGSAARTEKLGTKEIQGVRAEGTRTVVTIPAGAIGNQAPIEVVSERWYSPELQAVVLSRRVDPRFGETTYRVENIVRAEPPADLFQVPSDYKIDTLRTARPGTFVPAPPR